MTVTVPTKDDIRRNYAGLSKEWQAWLEARSLELEALADDDLVAEAKQAVEKYYASWFDLRYLGSSGDTVTVRDRECLLIDSEMTRRSLQGFAEHYEMVWQTFQRRCQDAESESHGQSNAASLDSLKNDDMIGSQN